MKYIRTFWGGLIRPWIISIVIVLTAIVIVTSLFYGPQARPQASDEKFVTIPVNKSVPNTDAGRAGAYELANAYRRQQVIDATWRVIARDGITHASLRDIASEMNLTTGFVTRYFPEKQALLLASLEAAGTVLGNEIVAATAGRTGMARVEAAVMAALPITKEGLAAWQVWVAFLGVLPGEPALAQAHAVFPDQLRQMLVQGIREAQLAGDIVPQAHPPQLADMLLNQIIGLGIRAVSEPGRYSPEKLQGLIAPLFTRLLQ